MKEEEIRAVILEEIKEVSHVDIAELDENLFGDRCCINTVDMVYVVDHIEKRLGKPIAEIFINEDYTIMTVNRMAKEIELLICK